MKVSDVMSRHVDSVSAETKVKDLAVLIFGRGINGVPVCKGKKVVGFITERDILAKFYPSMQEYVEDPAHTGDFEEMEDKVQEIFEMPAEKIMSKNVTTVAPETQLLRAQSLMFIHKVGRLPVIDEGGNLVGIVSKGDIFRALVGDRVLFTENEDYNDWLSKTYYAAVDTKDRMTHEIPDLLKIFRENKVKIVLDVGCGTGDHIIELAKRGFQAVGIDRSKAMIKEANKRKEVLSKQEQQRVQFFHGETEALLERLKATFDVALFMGNTISHNPHNYQEVIKKAAQYLSEQGVMIFQITNFEKILKIQNRLVSFNFAKVEDGITREYAFLEFYDPPKKEDKTILKTFIILTFDGKRWRWSGTRNSFMAYTTEEIIKKVLEKNGFSKISFYGSFFDGRKWDFLFRKPFKPLESDWLNVIAKR